MRPDAPPDIVAKLRAICLALPDVREEAAWVGTRWRIRKETFAHVLMIDGGWPPAYAKAAGSDGPLCVLTFRSAIAELDPRHYAGAPFFRPVWFRNIVGLALDAHSDWPEIADLLTASYCLLAPRKLADRVKPSPT
jgi:hypothetical protein